MLTISDWDVGYGESLVLRNLHLQIEPGTVVTLMGRNGVGKTTLLRSMIGLLRNRKGKIHFMGEDLTTASPEIRARKGIGYVPQGRDIFGALTVEENLLLGLEALSKTERRKGIPEDVYEMFPVLKTMLHRKGGDLSGGQQQQLAIARALVAKPKLLLLDEPMEGIQPSIVQLISDVIKKIATNRTVSILLVEHNVDLALECADYYYILDKSSIVAQGETHSLHVDSIKEYLVV